MRDFIFALALSSLSIAMLTLSTGFILMIINDWRDSKIRRQREALELERLMRETIILQGRKAEL